MGKAEVKPPLPWENQWQQPSVEQLLEPLKENMQETFRQLMHQADELEDAQWRLTWYGSAWKWTIELAQHDGQGREIGRLAYLVPNPESAVISIGLADEFFHELSRKRLAKYLREGLRTAKCAVQLHWTWWTPSSRAETEHLTELIQRYHKWLRQAEDQTASEPANEKTKTSRKSNQSASD